MGTLVDTVSFHPHLCTMHSQVISVLFLGLMACSTMASVIPGLFNTDTNKVLGVKPKTFIGDDPRSLTVPVEGADDNNDGVADKLDLNRDGKVDVVKHPLAFGHLGFPFFGLPPAVVHPAFVHPVAAIHPAAAVH